MRRVRLPLYQTEASPLARSAQLRIWLRMVVTLVLLGVALQVQAQLKSGVQAPLFKAPAAEAGKVVEFDLAKALKQGAVVLYFYPKAFTSGCTIEAQLFAESMPEFRAHQATVVGVSGDDIKTLQEFSLGPCAGKFSVASDNTGDIMKAYDAALMIIPGMADRISYVIAPNGKILDVYDSMSPQQHVSRTLAAVKAWHKTSSKNSR